MLTRRASLIPLSLTAIALLASVNGCGDNGSESSTAEQDKVVRPDHPAYTKKECADAREQAEGLVMTRHAGMSQNQVLSGFDYEGAYISRNTVRRAFALDRVELPGEKVKQSEEFGARIYRECMETAEPKTEDSGTT